VRKGLRELNLERHVGGKVNNLVPHESVFGKYRENGFRTQRRCVLPPIQYSRCLL